MATTNDGLGNQSLLAKIDKLRELNVGAFIPLPQLIVVGDQSSGKSSVLEGLTGFSFPRAAGLCTRYATQITCCREPQKSVAVSIIPRPDADETLKARLLQFQRGFVEMNNSELTKLFEEANTAMGIRMSMDDDDPSLAAFSQDILKIEISGPDQTHLTVIDVPGIFRVPTPGRFFLVEIYRRAHSFTRTYYRERRGASPEYGEVCDKGCRGLEYINSIIIF
ncbi:P-loop containing nucleoside triphosphate hydrolase protein [Whalleya microplaca]|nr:P-loop containing nucleoside triphosphate hydrolase protein [Whalleya microplaca]